MRWSTRLGPSIRSPADCTIGKDRKLIIMPSMHPPDSSGIRERREIKQIATLSSGEIVALCNDATVWIYAGSGWQKLPDIPKEDRSLRFVVGRSAPTE